MAETKIPYKPQTDYGRGVLPPLVRAVSHAMFVVGAHFHEWPMTVEQAQLELGETNRHMAGLADIKEILSEESVGYINAWKSQVEKLEAKIAEKNRTDPDALITDLKPEIKTFSEATFGLLSKLDEDLCGLTPTQTDPGKLP